MTINQAIDKLTSGNELTPDQEKLKLSLIDAKMLVGGRTKVSDEDAVQKILEQTKED